jgi:hypothetical protein
VFANKRGAEKCESEKRCRDMNMLNFISVMAFFKMSTSFPGGGSIFRGHSRLFFALTQLGKAFETKTLISHIEELMTKILFSS